MSGETPAKTAEEIEQRQQILPYEHTVALAEGVLRQVRVASPDDMAAQAIAHALVLVVKQLRDVAAIRIGGAA